MSEFPEKESRDHSKSLVDDLDFDLMTFREYSILISDDLKFNDYIVKRAQELGFNAFHLTQEQKDAATFCMCPEELEVASRGLEIAHKNRRLKKQLSKEERMIVEAHVRNTKFFGNFDSIESEKAKQEYLKVADDEYLGACAFLYSWVMEKHDEKMFEALFSFLPEKRQNAALDAGVLFLFRHGAIKLGR